MLNNRQVYPTQLKLLSLSHILAILLLVPFPPLSAQPPPPKNTSTSQTPTDTSTVQDLRGRVPFLPYDYPNMVKASEVTYLPDNEPIVGLDYPEGRRAYPLRIVSWHHVINDSMGKRPIVITYCKACDSGVVFDPMVRGNLLHLALYGSYKGTIVMIDKETEGLWYQLDGSALQGKWRKASLKMLPMERMEWGKWKKLHPDTEVIGLSKDVFNQYPSLDPPTPQLKTPEGYPKGVLVAGSGAILLALLFLVKIRQAQAKEGTIVIEEP